MSNKFSQIQSPIWFLSHKHSLIKGCQCEDTTAFSPLVGNPVMPGPGIATALTASDLTLTLLSAVTPGIALSCQQSDHDCFHSRKYTTHRNGRQSTS